MAIELQDALNQLGADIFELNATLTNIAENTVEVTGPALAETADGALVRLPIGSTAGAGNNDDWVEVGAGGAVTTADITDAGTFGKELLQSETLADAQTKLPSSEITFFALVDESVSSKRVVGSLGAADTPSSCAYCQIGSAVTSIGSYAFLNNALTSVAIPNSVTSIGDEAFRGNSLTSVTIPESVTEIKNSAFTNNSIESVTIPDSVIEIRVDVFSFNSLQSITFGNSVEKIGNNAFAFNSIESVTIPNLVTEIGSYAFAYNSIESVTLGNSVETIGEYAFVNNSIESVTIPNSVTEIGNNAFAGNSLQSVTLGNSVETIGEYVFVGNSTLNTVTANITRPVFDTGTDILIDTEEPLTLRVPAGDTTWDELENESTPRFYQGNNNVIIERF
jgi:predicted metalloprotease